MDTDEDATELDIADLTPEEIETLIEEEELTQSV